MANPAAIKQYEGLKYTGDEHDAEFPHHPAVPPDERILGGHLFAQHLLQEVRVGKFALGGQLQQAFEPLAAL